MIAMEDELRLMEVDHHLYHCSPTIIVSYTLCPISCHVYYTLWLNQISEDMGHPGKGFHRPSKTSNQEVYRL